MAVFFVFFWEEDPFPDPPLEIWVGDGRFLALESEGDCCFNGVVLRESNARDGEIGVVIRAGEIVPEMDASAFSSLAASSFSSPSSLVVGAFSTASEAAASFSY